MKIVSKRGREKLDQCVVTQEELDGSWSAGAAALEALMRAEDEIFLKAMLDSVDSIISSQAINGVALQRGDRVLLKDTGAVFQWNGF